MSWEKILKISDRERAEAEDFATEDMDDWRSQREREQLEMERLAGREYAEKMKVFAATTKEFIEDLKLMREMESAQLLEMLVEKLESEIAKENPSEDTLRRWRNAIILESRIHENSPFKRRRNES